MKRGRKAWRDCSSSFMEPVECRGDPCEAQGAVHHRSARGACVSRAGGAKPCPSPSAALYRRVDPRARATQHPHAPYGRSDPSEHGFRAQGERIARRPGRDVCELLRDLVDVLPVPRVDPARAIPAQSWRQHQPRPERGLPEVPRRGLRVLHDHPGTGSTTYVPPGWDVWFAVMGPPWALGIDVAYYDYVVNENSTNVRYHVTPPEYETDVLRNAALAFICAEASDSE